MNTQTVIYPDITISIVTVSFNQRPYLACAMESVLTQSFPYVEYILVDPGSSDGSREMIQGYQERIDVRVFEPDQGAADGLNKGFARSSGEVLGFLNADDVLMPGSLAKVAQFFAERQDCEILVGDGLIIDAEGRVLRRVRARHFTLKRYLHCQRDWIQQSIFFRRRSFLQAGGFNPANRTCWDGELFAHMLRQGATVEYLDKDLAAFRIHSRSNTGAGVNWEQYKSDSRRIFRDNTKRDWNLADTVLGYLYRVESGTFRLRNSWARHAVIK